MTAQPRMLGGRYEIGGVLGYGGMAEVHRGADLRLGRDVAIKMLRTDLARDETFLTRFRREAQNAASLNHPSIVAVYDTGEDTGNGTPVPYIVMEYVGGRTLKEVLLAEGQLAPRRTCEIVADVCAALDFSHRHQIIHRDVKPGNVMLSQNGQVKVMDFGIARAMASGQATMTQTSAVIGTAQYLSPEQARGETVDARSDVYATGCLMYELLCGDPPFTGDNPVSVAYQHVREAPRPPSQVNPDVPPAVDAIVLRALAKNPENRYQTAGEMREDLERAIAGRPVMAPAVMSEDERTQMLDASEPGEPTRTVPAAVEDPEKKSKTGRNIAIVALLLVLFAGLGYGTYYWTVGNKVEMPKVTAKTQEDATDQLELLGLEVKAEEAPNPTFKEGTVADQKPKPKTQIAKGETVTLIVSSGPEQVTVPQLEKVSSCDDVDALLKKAELASECTTEPSTEEEGSILEQDPQSGAEVDKDTTVTVVLSGGGQAEVPGVVSMQYDSACSRLEEKGFTCDIDWVAGDDDNDPGEVISQEPGAEQTAEEGTTVVVKAVGVKVPKLTGMSVQEAQEIVSAEELDIELDIQPGEHKPDWKVKSQDAKPDDFVEPGTTVVLEAEEDEIGI